MKLIADLYGVPDGAVYPVWYRKGSECPPELEAAALAVGALKPKARNGQNDLLGQGSGEGGQHDQPGAGQTAGTD